MDYGRANHFDFDNPEKWVTVTDVPLLDEHEMTDDDGNPIGYVDQKALQEIANNNNKRIIQTGDPATLILGHTSDDPKAPEKPAKGFVVNYKVKPFKRDAKTGRVIYAIHGDYKIRPKNAHIIEEYPRRSVELWWNRKELDPVALLGGTTPERDLSVVIRKARIKHSSLLGGGVPKRDLGHPKIIRFSRGDSAVESYEIGDDMPSDQDYDDPDMDNNDTDMDEDQGTPDTGDDPVVAKVLASKQFKDLAQKVDMIFQAIMSEEEEGQQQPGEEGAPGEGGQGQEEMEEAPQEESRREHGEQPIQFEGAPATGMPGPGSTTNPTFGNNREGPTRNSRREPTMNNDLVRLKRRNDALEKSHNDLLLKLARKEAEGIIDALEQEGILFGDNQEEAKAVKAEEAEFLALLSEQDRDYHVNKVIRRRYRRRQANPASPTQPGVARYSRVEDSATKDEFEPNSPQEASEFADLVTLRGVSREEAIKFMRKKRN